MKVAPKELEDGMEDIACSDQRLDWDMEGKVPPCPEEGERPLTS